jgi:hypothetical protein
VLFLDPVRVELTGFNAMFVAVLCIPLVGVVDVLINFIHRVDLIGWLDTTTGICSATTKTDTTTDTAVA